MDRLEQLRRLTGHVERAGRRAVNVDRAQSDAERELAAAHSNLRALHDELSNPVRNYDPVAHGDSFEEIEATKRAAQRPWQVARPAQRRRARFGWGRIAATVLAGVGVSAAVIALSNGSGDDTHVAMAAAERGADVATTVDAAKPATREAMSSAARAGGGHAPEAAASMTMTAQASPAAGAPVASVPAAVRPSVAPPPPKAEHAPATPTMQPSAPIVTGSTQTVSPSPTTAASRPDATVKTMVELSQKVAIAATPTVALPVPEAATPVASSAGATADAPAAVADVPAQAASQAPTQTQAPAGEAPYARRFADIAPAERQCLARAIYYEASGLYHLN